jgi:hypothetical protein
LKAEETEVAAKTAINAKNLEALGAARLAELLVEVSAGNATAKRRLRLELAAAKSPGDIAKEARKRLTTIGRSRSFVDWQAVRSLAGDLDLQRSTVMETLAKTDATEALDLLWRFMALICCGALWRWHPRFSSDATTVAAPLSASSARLAATWVGSLRAPAPIR